MAHACLARPLAASTRSPAFSNLESSSEVTPRARKKKKNTHIKRHPERDATEARSAPHQTAGGVKARVRARKKQTGDLVLPRANMHFDGERAHARRVPSAAIAIRCGKIKTRARAGLLMIAGRGRCHSARGARRPRGVSAAKGGGMSGEDIPAFEGGADGRCARGQARNGLSTEPPQRARMARAATSAPLTN